MRSGAFALTAYRIRKTALREWGSAVAVVVLIGVLGGVSLAAIAGARRTQSAFPIFVESTNPSDLFLPTAGWQPGQPNDAGSSLVGADLVKRLPLVIHESNSYDLNAQPIGADGYPIAPPRAAQALGISTLNNYGSIDGEFTEQDRATAVQGRLPGGNRENEIDLAPIVAQALDAHVGQTIDMGFYTNKQTILPGYGTSSSFKVKPYRKMEMKVVGLVDFNNKVVVDSLDQTGTANILYSPALTKQLLSCCVSTTNSYLRLSHGTDDVGRVEEEVDRAAGTSGYTSPTFGVEPDISVAERTIRPESMALAVFGAIAAVATLLIAGQALVRNVRLREGEEQVLRALGAGPAFIVLDSIARMLTAVLAGSLVAAGVGVALSPITPLGIVRPVYPYRGFSFDWTVLGLGCAAFVVILGTVTVVSGVRLAPHRLYRQSDRNRRIPSSVRVASGIGLPPASVEGIRFAFDPGGGYGKIPVRSAILGGLSAVVVLVATVTFGASLNALVSHPNLYGWNWNYELTGGGGIAPVPGHLATTLLDRDKSIEAWSPVTFGGEVSIDGQIVPDIGQAPKSSVTPPITSGHGLEATDQIVLGGETLAALNKRVGDTVTVRTTPTTSKTLTVVGTATMPVVGMQVEADHASMGIGALLPSALIPADVSNLNNVTPYGPSAIFIRLRPGVNTVSAQSRLEAIAKNYLTLPTNYGVSLLSVQRPAEIINYPSMGTAPALLGASLATGAVVALCLTLVASVRRRRIDLAILKTLGFTRHQLAATVAWQATVAVGIGAAIGIPIGIFVGRLLWDAFAQEIDAVPQPLIPGLTILAIGFGAIVLAIVVALLPGRLAAKTPAALVLRTQ